MAIILFLFGSVLGIIGAALQLSLGFGGFGDALQTYCLTAIGLPSVTLLSLYVRPV